jgi:hypothetical protein
MIRNRPRANTEDAPIKASRVAVMMTCSPTRDGLLSTFAPTTLSRPVTEYLCPDHAFEAGYCAACGTFWAGIEEFDMGNGLCPNCRAGINEEDDEDGSGDYEDAPF